LCSFLVIVEDLLCEFLPLAVAGEGLALQDQNPLRLQLNNSVYNLKGLSHETDLAFDDMYG
jgi:hypothetical protein